MLGSDELPSTYERDKIIKEVEKFRNDVLFKCTDTQILAAIDWCLNGDKCDTDDLDEKDKKEIDEVYEIPDHEESLAKHLLLTAMSEGMSSDVAKYALIDELENMILCASIEHGAKDIVKNEHTQAAGKFYVAAGRIHERLLKEKKNEKNEGEKK